MKRIIIAITVLLSSTAMFAQSNKEDIEMLQAAFGKEKKELMQAFVKLDATNKDAFWALYDEYEMQRKELGKKRIALINKYAENYNTADDAKINEIVKELAKLSGSYEKLMSTYYAKISKAAGVKPAAQFYQMEGYLLSVVRVKIMDIIPFFGELDY
ncbi:MAG: hypothetical protein ACK4IY_00725 [Chitinophagales bacterium]